LRKIALGADHAGFDLKEAIKKYLDLSGYTYTDFGILNPNSADYPQYAYKVAQAVAQGEYTQGILICGTGIGMCITANKVKGIRAGLAYNSSTAELSRSHNDTNILCLGGRELTPEQALEIVDIWLKTPFEGGRHKTRVDMISKLTGQ
jgi:ribose 5-phosphate isomerase B